MVLWCVKKKGNFEKCLKEMKHMKNNKIEKNEGKKN